MTRPVDRTRTEESHRGLRCLPARPNVPRGWPDREQQFKGWIRGAGPFKISTEALGNFIIWLSGHANSIPIWSSSYSQNRNETKNQRKTSSLGTIISPKWIQMVYSQGHSTYHSSYNSHREKQSATPQEKQRLSLGIILPKYPKYGLNTTSNLFDTTSQIRPDDKSLLNISISPDMEACMPWDTFHIFQLLRIVFHLGSWWDGRGCTAQENSPGGEDLDRQRLRHWKYPRTIGFTTILPPSMKGSPFGNAVSIERLGWWCHPLPSRAGLRKPTASSRSGVLAIQGHTSESCNQWG